jgi:hypothetical protein
MDGDWSTVQTDIPCAYWEAADIYEFATDKVTDTELHTFPHRFTDGTFGDEIFLLHKTEGRSERAIEAMTAKMNNASQS